MARRKKSDTEGKAGPETETPETPPAEEQQDKDAVSPEGAAEPAESPQDPVPEPTDELQPEETAQDGPDSPADASADAGPDADEPEIARAMPEPAPQPAPARRSGGFLAAVLGGAVAAVLGFAVGRAPDADRYLPGFLQSGTAQALAELRVAADAQADALSALRAEVEARPVPDISGVEAAVRNQSGEIARISDEIAALRSRITTAEARLEGFETRLTDLEKRPLAENVSAAAREAYERELDALRAEVRTMVETARAAQTEARTHEVNAAEAAELARHRATAARLRAALNDGAPIAPLLEELSQGGVAVPGDLAAAAAAGVDTMAALIADFPPAARAALAADRAAHAGEGGFGAFLRRQLGARSVQPRDGDSADAILSRAEAALLAGDLDRTLAEITSLPSPARAEMQDWADRAAIRARAVAAADALAQSLNSN